MSREEDVKRPSKRALKDINAFLRVLDMVNDGYRMTEAKDFVRENKALNNAASLKLYLKHCKGVKIVCKS